MSKVQGTICISNKFPSVGAAGGLELPFKKHVLEQPGTGHLFAKV